MADHSHIPRLGWRIASVALPVKRHRFPVKHAVKQRFNTTRARAQDLRTSKHGGRNRMDGGMAEALTPTRNVRLTPQRDPDPCIAHLRKTSPFKAFIQYHFNTIVHSRHTSSKFSHLHKQASEERRRNKMCLCSCVTRATKRDTGRSVTTPRRPARAGRSKLRFVGRSGSTYNLVSLLRSSPATSSSSVRRSRSAC